MTKKSIGKFSVSLFQNCSFASKKQPWIEKSKMILKYSLFSRSKRRELLKKAKNFTFYLLQWVNQI